MSVALTDDKKLTTTLKRIGVTNIPAIEEVNMFKNDGEVIHFVGPKGESVRRAVRALITFAWYTSRCDAVVIVGPTAR